jgi:hypothetical protein
MGYRPSRHEERNMATGTQQAAPTRTHVSVGRDILVALAIKLSLLAVLYHCFFGDSHRPKTDPRATAVALLDNSTVNP